MHKLQCPMCAQKVGVKRKPGTPDGARAAVACPKCGTVLRFTFPAPPKVATRDAVTEFLRKCGMA